MLFKSKYKKSEWMQGFLECEEAYKKGMRQITTRAVEYHLWIGTENGNFVIGVDINKNLEKVKGYLDYINYFENNLK